MIQKTGENRIWEYILIIWFILTLNFFLPRIMPGDPFLFVSADQAGDEVAQFSDEQRDYYRNHYGLDRPVLHQYISYCAELVRGDLGYSLYYNESVAAMIAKRLPWTLFLVVTSLALSTCIGTALGGLSALYRDRWGDRLLYLLLISVSEIPSFLVGLVLLFFLAAGLGLFPLSGAMTHFADFGGWGEKLVNILHHGALPVAALTFTRLGGIYLLARASFITVLSKDYMRTARAKGLSGGRIFMKHGLANAMLPIVTRVFLSLGSLLGGAILVENVFSYPGVGTLMRDAVMVHDYPLVQGLFLVVTVSVLSANFFADRVYRYIDPRIKDEYEAHLSGRASL